MKNKIISIFCIFLIVFSSFSVYVYAESDIVALSYDSDDDGVCDKNIPELMEQEGVKEESEFISKVRPKLRCTPTEYGDKLCPDTIKGEIVDMDIKSETSGCSASELKGFYDYWSINLKESRPKRVTMNWLLDQVQGVDVFQPLELTKNIVLESEKKNIDLYQIPRFDCYSYRLDNQGNKVRKNYLRFYRTILQDSENKTLYTLQFTLKQFTQNELSDKTIFGKRRINNKDVEGIDILCTTQIVSCNRTIATGPCDRLRGPPEVDEFEVFIPLERLVFHPPEAALEAGAHLADNIINTLDKIVPKLEKVARFSESVCYISAGLLLLGNVIGKIPGMEWLEEFANKIWDGIGHTDWFNTKSFKGGLIGGKAFCMYFACPKEWCPFAEQYAAKDAVVQDSLILSSGCLCFSGMYINLLKLKVILEEWKRCLEAARNAEQYAVYCEKYLSKYLCESIITEFMTFKGAGLRGKVFNKIKEAFEKIPGVTSSIQRVKEALEGKKAADVATKAVAGVKDFNKEVKPLAKAYVKGNLGYKKEIPQLICEYAFYRKIPELNIFERFKIEPLQWTTTILGNWNSRVAYQGLTEQDAVYEYDISWTIIAGSDNFRYKAYLEREGGGSLQIFGHQYRVHGQENEYNVNTGDGMLRKAGDLVADYVQITSREQFDKLCFYVPNEINEKQCFPAGSFDVGGPIGTNIFDTEIKDTDGDGLSDDWEIKYNCVEGRTDFENDADKIACEDLLKGKKNNILNPNSDDSDKNGVTDDKENPDGDLFTNYYEQQNNYNPNEANKDEGGRTIEASCYAQFGESVEPVTQEGKIGDSYKYKVGDNVKINFVLGSDTRLTSKDELLLMAEISNTDTTSSYYDLKTVELNKLNNVFEIKLKDDIKTGVYILKLSLVTQGVLKFKECTDPSNNKLAVKEFSLVVQDPSKQNCVDSDYDDYTKQGVCIDSSNIQIDSCDGNNLIEWACDNNKCKSEVTEMCGNSNLCSEGRCILNNCGDDDPNNNFAFPGTCKFKDEKGHDITSNDYCLSGELVQFSCKSGQCETEAGSCPEDLVCTGTNDISRGPAATCVKQDET